MTAATTSDLWWKNAVVYCLDVETFADGNGDGCGDFVGLTDHVDYLAGIGVTCIWLMPFYPSPDRDDGYDVTDYYGVDPRLGSHGDVVAFVRTANDRGIRVIADLIVNHTSDQHPWFKAARADRRSPLRDYYVWRDEPTEMPQGVVFPDAEDSLWAYDEGSGQYYLHHFYAHQPDLNIANPAVRHEIAKVLGFWLQVGLAGFRVDAVPFLLETSGISGDVDLDPHAYLRDLRAFMSRRRGDAVLLGEVNLEPADQRAFFGDEDGDELHMLFDFVGMQSLYLSLARGDAGPLRKAFDSLPEIPDESQWATFVRNHDELTLDKLSDAEREDVFAAFAPDEDMQLFGRGVRRRLPPMLDGDQRRIRLVYNLMFSLPGTPVLFYGEEIGMGENLSIPGRLSVRTPMQWSPAENGGFSDAPADALVAPLVEGDYGPAAVNVADQRRDPESLLNFFERLMRLRKQCPEIGFGRGQVLDAGDPAVFASRCDWRGGTVVAVHNLGAQACRAEVDLGDGPEPGAGDAEVSPLLGEGECRRDGDRLSVELPGYGSRWMRLGEPRRRPY